MTPDAYLGICLHMSCMSKVWQTYRITYSNFMAIVKPYQGEQPLAVFLCEKLKELLTLIMGRFICPAVFVANSSTQKILKINLKKEESLILF